MRAQTSAGTQSARGKCNVCVISQTPEIYEAVRESLRGNDNIATQVLDKPIERVNGSAAQVLAANDVIIVDLNSAGDEALPALQSMLEKRKGSVGIVALSDGQISLAEARRYRMLGIDDVLPVPFAPQDLAGAIGRCAEARGHAASASGARKKGMVLGVAHASGGAGATTLAVNLALALLGRRGVFAKKAQRSVAIADLNLQFGTVAHFLDLRSESGLMAMIASDQVPDATSLRSLITRHDSGLSVVTAPDKPVPVDALQSEQVDALIRALAASHDVTVLDLPVHQVGWMEHVLKGLDRMFIVTDLSVPSVLNANRLIELYAEERVDLPVDVVVNREKKPGFGSRLLKDAQQVLNRKLAFWMPEDVAAARDAVDRGVPVIDSHAGSRLAKSIRELAEHAIKNSSVDADEHAEISR